MWTLPSTRNAPPATKYFGSLLSWEWSSASGYGSSRTGGDLPGSRRASAQTATAANATYVTNCSELSCLTNTPAKPRASAQSRLYEVDREDDRQVEHDHHG